MGWAWSAILVGSLLTIVGFARAGSTLFWKSTAIAAPKVPDGEEAAPAARPAGPAEVAPAMLALGVLAAAAVFAGPLSAYLESTSEQLFDRAGYVSAVLGNEEEG
jgi:multicomponent K+:H+ antiporter subunit D